MTGTPRDDIVEERIESYLDRLLLAVRGRPREARRLLAEFVLGCGSSVPDEDDALFTAIAERFEILNRPGREP